jgi:hypothetical protein
MTLIAVASFSGSPGVTTAALGIAACWPAGAEPLLAEADPSGGDLQAWYGMPDTPGMVSLAAAARRGHGPDLLAGHAARLPGGLRVLPGPVGASQAHAAASQLAAVGYEPVTAAAAAGQVIVADCGRLTPGTPVTALLDAAAVLLVVTAGDPAALAHVHARLGALGALADVAGRTELLLSGRPGPADRARRTGRSTREYRAWRSRSASTSPTGAAAWRNWVWGCLESRTGDCHPPGSPARSGS